jgi:ribosomal protein S19E (S16A)
MTLAFVRHQHDIGVPEWFDKMPTGVGHPGALSVEWFAPSLLERLKQSGIVGIDHKRHTEGSEPEVVGKNRSKHHDRVGIGYR